VKKERLIKKRFSGFAIARHNTIIKEKHNLKLHMRKNIKFKPGQKKEAL